jgi:hypothetical protein
MGVKEQVWVDLMFPHYFRATFLILVLAFIEHELGAICDIHQRKHRVEYSAQELKCKSEFDKTRRYLTRAVGIDFNSLEPEWNFISVLRRIRNSLVHNQGKMQKESKNWHVVELFLKDYPVMTVEEIGSHEVRLVISDSKLNVALLSKAQSFFEKLIHGELRQL